MHSQLTVSDFLIRASWLVKLQLNVGAEIAAPRYGRRYGLCRGYRFEANAPERSDCQTPFVMNRLKVEVASRAPLVTVKTPRTQVPKIKHLSVGDMFRVVH